VAPSAGDAAVECSSASLPTAEAALPMQKSLLLMFDLDGTLIDSNAVDSEAFAAALRRWLATSQIDEDWSSYRQHSDHAIALEAFGRRYSRAPTDTELHDLRLIYGAALESRLAAAPDRCPPLAGAVSVVAALENHEEVAVGIATGAFERTALAKIRAARLQVGHWPRATSDDAAARVDFMKVCLRRVEAARGQQFSRIVYVGDGVWDAAACRQLGWPMVGIGSAAHAGELTSAGAAIVVPYYPMPHEFLETVRAIA
jgi:phosphoglycolate phosphatase-like HAD superfamily hydrolase